jgi:hypothetical protein
MDSNAEADQPIDKRDKRCREAHPEYIEAGDIDYERNDISAARYGMTARTLNTRDKKGAPYTYFGGIKYRPVEEFDEFMADGIRRQQPQQPKPRRRR